MFGIDYSLTCPAVCYYDTQGTVHFWYAHANKVLRVPNVSCFLITDAADVRTSRRAGALAAACIQWMQERSSIVSVVIEDYAFAAQGRVFHIGENAGILKYLLDQNNIPYTLIPPTVIKKYATGKGNADKFAMTNAFLEAYPNARNWQHELFPKTDGTVIPKSPLADLADAYWIAQYAVDHNTLVY